MFRSENEIADTTNFYNLAKSFEHPPSHLLTRIEMLI